jgi:hypothetical protein
MSNGRRKQLTKTALRKAIRNGSDLAKVDRRTAAMKRLTAHVGAHVSDLGGDLSHSERVLVQRVAILTLLTEMVAEQIIRSNLRTSHSGGHVKSGRLRYTPKRICRAPGVMKRVQPTVLPSSTVGVQSFGRDQTGA